MPAQNDRGWRPGYGVSVEGRDAVLDGVSEPGNGDPGSPRNKERTRES